MNEVLELRVDEASAGERVDRVVANAAGVTRSAARRLIESGAVEVDGSRVKPSDRVEAGQLVAVEREPPAEILPAADVPFAIAVEDAAFLVVDKPAGVVVHPGSGHGSDTLVNGLVAVYPELRDLGADRNWGLVHRLDRDTSGLLIVARTVPAHAELQAQLRARKISRRYRALCSGVAFDHATGTIDAPIGRDPKRATRMAVVATGRPARTHFKRLAAWGSATLLEVALETGRTHQIRVHLAAIGAPLIGDVVYGGSAWPGPEPARAWLHAHALDFVHPVGREPVAARSELPAELTAVLEALGAPSAGEVPRGGSGRPG